jgi:uncharacterized membrane protein HdeD (DUF308 family)
MPMEQAAADDDAQESVAQARVLFAIEGIILMLLGAVAIALPGLAAIVLTVLLGWLFFFSGVLELLMTMGTRTMPGFHWSLVSAVFALIAGAILIFLPVRDGAAFMIVLGVFFAVDGTFSVLYAFEHRRSQRWLWMLASGFFTVLLAAFILARISTSVPLLGMLVGVDLVFAGLALVIVGTGLKHEL